MVEHIKEITIAGLIWLESLALYLGIDGAYFSLVVGAVAGIAGYTIAKATK